MLSAVIAVGSCVVFVAVAGYIIGWCLYAGYHKVKDVLNHD